MSSNLKKSFKEIEHKFIVPNDFDRTSFMARLKSLGPTHCDEVAVEDSYYVLEGRRNHIYRFRIDRQIQQLTVKSVTSNTFERLEVNLNLDQSEGSQREAVEAFLSSFGLAWKASLSKDVAVAYFPDCEIVHYRAKSGDHEVGCIEFEATSTDDTATALKILKKYEQNLGFGEIALETKSLFDLLLLQDAPSDIVKLFSNRE